MQIYEKMTKKKDLSICLGFFDGVHEGHKVVIKNAVNLARQSGIESAVVTFKRHPLCYLQNRTPQYILSPEDRISMIEAQGVDNLFFLDFDEDTADMLAFDYLKNILIENFSPRYITTGFNHFFGANRQGDNGMLRDYQKAFSYEFFEIPPITFNNTLISSTKIRQLISSGELTDMKNLLGYEFYIKSKVQTGDRIGRTIGFPTANLKYPDNIIKIARGVYFALADVGGNIYKAVANYGVRPTVSGKKESILEAHLLGFSGDIYGKDMKLSFVKKIRDEKKFSSLVELKNQIEFDIKSVNQAD